MKNKTVFYAGYWNDSHTLAKIELEFMKGEGAWKGWRIVKVLKVYAGGKGMLAGSCLLDDEVKERIFDNYDDAKAKMRSDCADKISALLSEAAVFAEEIANITGVGE
jgi:hypothetical protein